ncbi:hypothetical protein RU639_006053 [Aspergillus parasiticus]
MTERPLRPNALLRTLPSAVNDLGITTVDALIPKQTNKHDASGVGAVTLHKTIVNSAISSEFATFSLLLNFSRLQLMVPTPHRGLFILVGN